MNVFLVSTGREPDLDIYGAYSTKEKAEEIRNRLIELGEHYCDVDELAVDTNTPPECIRYEVYSRIRSADVAYYVAYYNDHSCDGPTGSGFSVRMISGDRMAVTVWAHSAKHAVEIAADMFSKHQTYLVNDS